MAQTLWPSYDFKLPNADGDTIFYRITSTLSPHTVAVTRCHDSVYHNLPAPTIEYEVGQPGFLYPLFDYDSNLIIPSSVFFDGQVYAVTAIDKEAFFMQKGIHTVILPPSIETIDSGAFHRSALQQIVMSGNVKTINSYAFSSSMLKSIVLPSSLMNIGTRAFSSTLLSFIDIPENVKILPYKAFYNCPLTKIIFHEGLNEIHENAFSFNMIDSVIFPASLHIVRRQSDVTDESNLNQCKYIEFQQGDESLELGDNCFRDFINLKNVVLPNNLLRVGKSCFENTGIQRIDIPFSIDTVPQRCFSHCIYLSEVSLPSNLKYIEDEAFLETPELKRIVFPSTVSYIGNKAFRTYSSRGLENIDIYCEIPPTIRQTTFNNHDSILVRVPCERIPEYLSDNGWKSYSNFTFEDCVGIGEPDVFNIEIYPIPAKDIIHIICSAPQSTLKAFITDAIGQCVLTKHLQSIDTTLDISNIKSGIYILTITDIKGTLFCKKIIKK